MIFHSFDFKSESKFLDSLIEVSLGKDTYLLLSLSQTEVGVCSVLAPTQSPRRSRLERGRKQFRSKVRNKMADSSSPMSSSSRVPLTLRDFFFQV